MIYLAALTGVDESLYEAAYLDRASKLKRIIHITIPMIKPVIIPMVGLFQPVVNIIVLLRADKFAKKIGEEGII